MGKWRSEFQWHGVMYKAVLVFMLSADFSFYANCRISQPVLKVSQHMFRKPRTWPGRSCKAKKIGDKQWI